MAAYFKKISLLKEASVRAMLYASLVLIVPEFLAPLMALLSLAAAIRSRKGAADGKGLILGGTLAVHTGLYIIYMALSMLWSGDAFSSFLSVLMWLSMGALYLSLCTVITDRARMDRFLFILTMIMGICGIAAMLQHILAAYLHVNIDMQVWRWLDVAISKIVPYKVCYNFGNRAASFFANPNVFAYSFMMLIPFAMYYAFSRKRDVYHACGALALVFTFFGVLFTFSRGAYISMIFIVILFVAYHIKKLRMILLIAAVVLMLIPTSVYGRIFSIGDSNNFIHEVTDQIIVGVSNDGDGSGNFIENLLAAIKGSDIGMDGSVMDRFDGWATSMTCIEENPLLGYGAGYRNIYYVLHERGTPNYHAHNLVLQLLLEGGIVGLVLVMLVGAAVLKRGVTLMKKQSHHTQMGLAIIAFAVGFVISGMTDFILLTPKQMGCFFIALALCEVMASIYTDYENESITKVMSAPVKKLLYGETGEKDK